MDPSVKYKKGAHFPFRGCRFTNTICAGLSFEVFVACEFVEIRCHCTGRHLRDPMYIFPVLTCCTAFVQCEKCEASSKQAVLPVHVPVFLCSSVTLQDVGKFETTLDVPAEDYVGQAEPKVTDLEIYEAFHPKIIQKQHQNFNQIRHLLAHVRYEYG